MAEVKTQSDKDRKIKRLIASIDHSEKKLKRFRELRKETFAQYVGSHYGDNAAGAPVPFGLIGMMADIYQRSIMPRLPQIMVTANRRDLVTDAATAEADINQWVKYIELEKALRIVTIEAILAPVGVLKIGLQDNGIVDIGDGVEVSATRPFALPITLDHLILDMSAESWETQSYIGNRYNMPLEVAKNVPYWDEDVRNTLVARGNTPLDEQGQYATSQFSQGQEAPVEFIETVELMDIWLPDYQVVLTIPADRSGKVLGTVEWDGPSCGPYHALYFRPVPGNVLPVPPVAMSLYDLHDLSNVIFNKLGRQVANEKVILPYTGSQKDDAERIVRSTDSEAILQSDRPLIEQRFGGIQGSSLAFLLQVKDLFSWFSGNLDVLGGLSPQADTLGQEQILAGSASKLVADMQDRTVEFLQQVVRSLAWYHWTDPVRESNPVKPIRGTDLSVELVWSPETRRGSFVDYNYDIDVFSMQHQTPSSKLQSLMTVMQQIILPLLPMMEAQGQSLDTMALMEIVSRFGHMPELEDLIAFQSESVRPQASALGDSAVKSPTSNRTYTRKNVPGDSRQSRDREMTNMLLSGSMNNGKGQ